jgi:hypothetical protein
MIVEIRDSLLNLANFNYHSEHFIETGSCHGDGIKRAMIAGFYKIKSVEVHEPFYRICKEKFKQYAEPAKFTDWYIQLFLGKSYEQLPIMLQDVPKAVIMLDAHPAGPNTGGHDDLMVNGANSEYHQHAIIKKELDVIFGHGKDHLVIIDDQAGYSDDNHEYMVMAKHCNPDYRFYWYDEKLTKDAQLYKNKYLVLIP